MRKKSAARLQISRHLSKIVIMNISFILFFIFFILASENIAASTAVSSASSHPIISEIMFNPDGADSGNEWIELHNDNSDVCINLTKYKFFEDNVNHKINPVSGDIFCANAIITQSRDNLLAKYNLTIDNNTKIFESSFSLSNSGEAIGIKLGEEYADYIDYSQILPFISVEEGHSIEYSNNAWINSENSGGSPGQYVLFAENLFAENSTMNETINASIQPANISNASTPNVSLNHTAINSSMNSTNISVNVNISSNISSDNALNISLNNSSNSSMNDSLNVSLNNSLNITNSTLGNIADTLRRCYANISIIIKNETQTYNSKEQIKFQNKISFYENNGTIMNRKMNFSIEYWIEDASSNIVKKRVITSNEEFKSFTPSISEMDRALFIKSRLLDAGECDISNISTGNKMIVILNKEYKNSKPAAEKCSALKNDSACKCEGLIENICSPPLTKIVNVCNSTTQGQIMYSQQLQSANILETKAENPAEGMQSVNQMTSDVVKNISYESKTIKNRTYALASLVILVLSGAILLTYNHLKKKKQNT